MIGNRNTTVTWERIQGFVLIAAALVFFVMFTFWSGVPTGDQALPFWIGAVVMVIMLIGFGVATWHLLFRQLADGQSAEARPLGVGTRQVMALLLGTGGFGIV